MESPKTKDDAPQRDPELSSVSTGARDEAVLPAHTLDPVYEAKAKVLNRAIQDIGMGWYQWQLFIVIGFGWASDNLWPVSPSPFLYPVFFSKLTIDADHHELTVDADRQ
jgi:hypothetical protein